jgi:ribosomal protein S18 acetylase RimI-like enzyme
MQTAFTIRALTPADLPSLRDITWRSWMAAYHSFIREEDLRAYFDEHYSAEALAAFLRAPEHGGFMAEAAGAAAGCCRTRHHRQEGRFYIPSLYVLPRYQSRGAGTLLLQAAQRSAQAAGLREVWLGVMRDNTAALAWYRRQGFQFVREEPFTMGSATVGHLIGFKQLS